MAEIIPNGTAVATSSDITLTDGEGTILHLKSVSPPAISQGQEAQVQIKGSDGNYFTVGTLNHKEPAKLLNGPGVFRVRKLASEIPFGVDRD